MPLFRIRWREVVLRLPYIALADRADRWCALFGHDWTGWFEMLGRHASGRRHRQCRRCDLIETGE